MPKNPDIKKVLMIGSGPIIIGQAAEFAASTPYYYSVYGGENEVVCTNDKKKVLVLGSGPIRIGQGIEFDFCSVHCTLAFAKEGYETIIVNNNPETVSTDFDIADKLYFEPLTSEDVENIVKVERPEIHSGDSISVYPAQTISQTAKEVIEDYTQRLARALHVVGMINIQFRVFF